MLLPTLESLFAGNAATGGKLPQNTGDEAAPAVFGESLAALVRELPAEAIHRPPPEADGPVLPAGGNPLPSRPPRTAPVPGLADLSNAPGDPRPARIPGAAMAPPSAQRVDAAPEIARPIRLPPPPARSGRADLARVPEELASRAPGPVPAPPCGAPSSAAANMSPPAVPIPARFVDGAGETVPPGSRTASAPTSAPLPAPELRFAGVAVPLPSEAAGRAAGASPPPPAPPKAPPAAKVQAARPPDPGAMAALPPARLVTRAPGAGVETDADVLDARPFTPGPAPGPAAPPPAGPAPAFHAVVSAPPPAVAPPLPAMQPLDLPPGGEGFGDALGDRLVMLAGNRIQSAEIRLNPAELGPLRVQVSVDDGAATVSFHAQHPAAREAIEQALPRLREMFNEAGLSLGQASVSDQGMPKHDAERAWSTAAAAPFDDAPGLPEAEPAAARTMRRAARGAIDVFA